MKNTVVILWILLYGFIANAQTVQQADSLHQKGRELVNSGKVIEGRECTRQAMEIRKKLLGEISEDYITSLNNYALTFFLEQNYSKSLELQEQVMTLCSNLSKPHKNIGMYTINMGRYHYAVGNHTEAAKMWELALPLVEKYGEEYEFILNNLGTLYVEKNDMLGIEKVMALVEEHNRHELTKPCNEPQCMLERAQNYANNGNTSKAKECFQNVIEMSMDAAMKIAVYEEYARFMAMMVHDRQTGAEYQYQAAMIRKNMNGENADFAEKMYFAGFYYSLDMTDNSFQKALSCYEQALTIYERLNNATMVAKCKKLMGNAFSGLHEYAKARDCYQQVMVYYELNDISNNEYPKAIERLASAEKFNKEYEASIEHYNKALKIYEERGMVNEYANAENALKLCYAYAGKDMSEIGNSKNAELAKSEQTKKLNDIIEKEKKNLELTKRHLGNLVYARSLATIAGCYAIQKNKDEAISYFKQYIEFVRDAIREDFRLQSEAERMQTWNDEERNITGLQELLTIQPDSKEQADNMAALAYDSELLSKGILLNSTIEFESLLHEINAKHLLDVYKKAKDNRAEIERLRQHAASDADLEKILSLMQENQQLQTVLNNGCKEMDDFTKYISYNWKDVQEKLQDGDICIEFAAVNTGFGNCETHMVALILTKDIPQPITVTLWDEDKLHDYGESDFAKKIDSDYIFSGFDKAKLKELREALQLSDTYLKPELSLYLHYLENQSDTAKGVFFPSPLFTLSYDLLLNQEDLIFNTPDAGNMIWGRLADYLKGKKRIFFAADGLLNSIGIEYLQYQGKPLFEQFDVYRLSSTKELCYSRNTENTFKSALFGDINYIEESSLTENTKKAVNDLRAEDGLANLEYTLHEINEIEKLINGKYPSAVSKFRDTQASKEVFKNLSGTKVNILHVATHGIYNNVEKATDAESMQNSKLAFANAAMDEANMMSAAEVASMNLRHCKLAVLSACETGLGKLGGDGVFGLQRGFKNAGVQTLLMSLKKVHDESTAELMISFYKHLLQSGNKREALKKAQQDIRNKGWDDPKYWAAFILLDALD